MEGLGHHIVSRRVALGYRNRTDLANSLQFTVRTLSDIENGVRKASPGTYAMLENKLGWAPGSIDSSWRRRTRKSLVGPACAPPRPPLEPTPTTATRSLVHLDEELLLELRRRIVRPRNRRYETWDEWGDGLDAQGSWPEER